MKIQYLTTEFVHNLMINTGESDEQAKIIADTLEQYFNYDLILLPFMQRSLDHQHKLIKNELGEEEYACGCFDEKRIVLVSVKVLDNQVDLFDKEFRDNDSKSEIISKTNFIQSTLDHDISNCVLHIMDNASKMQNIELDEE